MCLQGKEEYRMIQLPVWKKQKEKLTCKEATKMVIPYIEGQMCDEELRRFVSHVKECPDCREELETYYIVYKGLMQLDEREGLSMNMIEALNEDLEDSGHHLRNMSLFYVVSGAVKWIVNVSCALLMIEKIMKWILGVLS